MAEVGIDVGDDRARVDLALSVADYFRLSADDARTVLRDVAAAVSHWRQAAHQHGLTEPEIGAMAPAFGALSDVG